MLGFFLDYRKTTYQTFDIVFSRKESENKTFQNKSSINWGWYHIIQNLAQNDVLKINEVLKLKANEALFHLSYVVDMMENQKTALQSNR